MNYPTHVIYATADEVKAKLKEVKLEKQRDVLKKCETLRVVEIEGDLKAAVDMELYQFLVNYLRQGTEADRNDFK